MLFLGKAAVPFYYLVVLMQLTLLTPIFIKCSEKKILSNACLLITPLFLLVIYSYQIITKHSLPYYSVFFCSWCIFYYLGIFVFQKKYKKCIGNPYVLLLVAGLLSVLEGILLYKVTGLYGFATSQIRFSSMFLSLAVINIIIGKIESNKSGVLVKVGDISFGIFFIHMIPLTLIGNMIECFFPNIPLVFFQIIQWTGTVFISYAIIIILKKCIPHKIQGLLGL